MLQRTHDPAIKEAIISKKRYLMKTFHKMLTRPPSMGFVKSFCFGLFFTFVEEEEKRFCEIWQTRPPGL